MSPDDAFKKLCHSAFEFLERSVAEFEKEPKFALVHFSTGLELLLKARLLKEHWSLVVVGKADLKQFRSGESTTVSIKDALERLDTVVGEPVPKDARTAFENIARHRNRVMHFFLEVGDKDRQQLIEEVAKDLYIGWYHLRERIKAWGDQFADFQKDLRSLDGKMKRARAYLQVVFDRLKPELDAKKQGGVEIATCPGCMFDAGVVETIAHHVFAQRCAVCALNVSLLRFECPECGTSHEINGWDHFQQIQCQCGESISQSEVKDWLDTNCGDYTNPEPPIGCAACGGDDTVVEHEELFVCVQCAEHSESAPQCEWCSQRQIGCGSLDDSYLEGCEFCEGRGMDDD